MAATVLAALWSLICALGSTGYAQDAKGPGTHVQLAAPRPFGYRIGDTLQVAGVIGVPAGFELEGNPVTDGGLPEWLEMRDQFWEVRDQGNGRAYRFRLVFQLFYAPDSVTRLTVPERRVTFREAESGERLEAVLPELAFTISPITRGTGPIAADYVVPAPSPRPLRLAGGALAVLLTLLGLGVALRRPRQPDRFRAAHRRIERARDCAEGTLVLHRALEEEVGGAVFRADLDRLAQRWPAAETVRDDLRRFFELSETLFYEDDRRQMPEDCLDWLRELSRQLMALEHRPGNSGPAREERAWNSPDPGS